MTEDEAKTKWCPFVRFVPESVSVFAGTTRGIPLTRDEGVEHAGFSCIGSACMAWRRDPDRALDTKAGWANDGYCGLAGKPLV